MSLNNLFVRKALAQVVDPGGGGGGTGELPHTFENAPVISESFQSFGGVLAAILNVVFYAGVSLTIIFLIIGGIRYVMSGGDKAGVEAARSSITNAIIGFIVVIGAFTIKIIVQNMLGVTNPPDILPSF